MTVAVKKKPESAENVEKSICFVQITRLGDLIQTYRVASSLKKEKPDIKLYLIARKQFAEPILFLLEECFNRIYSFDVYQWIDEESTLKNTAKKITSFCQMINANNFDVLINFSWSKSSEYLCLLIKAAHKLGVQKDRHNQTTISDSRSQWVYATTMRGSYAPCNLVDVYRSIVGLGEIDLSLQRPHNPKSKNIVLHPFASLDRKHWKISKWIEVIYKVLKSNDQYHMAIVGGIADQTLTDDILKSPILRKYRMRIHAVAGKLEVKELLDLIKNSAFFIGHDSFVSHLASLTTIPMMTLSLGSVRPHETAPYTEHAYVVAPNTSCFPCFPDEHCSFYQCHADIPYQVIAEMINVILDQGYLDISRLEKSTMTFLMNSVTIFKTKLLSSKFLFLSESTSLDPTIKDIFRTFYRVAYLYLLNRVEEEHPFPSLNRRTAKELEEIQKGLDHFFKLCEFGKNYSKRIVEEIGEDVPNVATIKSYSNKLDEIDRLQEMIGKTYPPLALLADFALVNRKNILGESIVRLAESSFFSCHNASLFCSILGDLSQKSLRKYYESRGIQQEKRVED